MRNINKKGISPLIATVLLIGFTVALAAFVITWGGEFVQNTVQDTEERSNRATKCVNDLNFEIEKVTCGAGKTIVIDNRGNIDIKNIAFRFFDTTGANTGSEFFSAANINKYEVKTLTLTNVVPVSTNKVEALATIVIDGLDVVCSENLKRKTLSTPC